MWPIFVVDDKKSVSSCSGDDDTIDDDIIDDDPDTPFQLGTINRATVGDSKK